MADLQISEALAKRLEGLARQENQPVEVVLSAMIEKREAEQVDPAKVRQFRAKLYRIAREYWQQAGDQERLALTDADLDEQFWLIDHEGIPRLKADQGKVELPPDPLEALIGLIDTDATDLSSTVRETIQK